MPLFKHRSCRPNNPIQIKHRRVTQIWTKYLLCICILNLILNDHELSSKRFTFNGLSSSFSLTQFHYCQIIRSLLPVQWEHHVFDYTSQERFIAVSKALCEDRFNATPNIMFQRQVVHHINMLTTRVRNTETKKGCCGKQVIFNLIFLAIASLSCSISKLSKEAIKHASSNTAWRYRTPKDSFQI